MNFKINYYKEEIRKMFIKYLFSKTLFQIFKPSNLNLQNSIFINPVLYYSPHYQFQNKQTNTPFYSNQNTYDSQFHQFQFISESIQSQFSESSKNITQNSQNQIFLSNLNIQQLTTFTKSFIVLIGEKINNKILNYQILIIRLNLKIKVLNSVSNATQNLNKVFENENVLIYKLNQTKQKNIYVKRINLKNRFQIAQNYFCNQNDESMSNVQQQIENILCQFGIDKIFSYFKIGFKMVSYLGFDMVYNKNSIQIYFEEDDSKKNESKNLTINQMIKNFNSEVNLFQKIQILQQNSNINNLITGQQFSNFIFTNFKIYSYDLNNFSKQQFILHENLKPYQSKDKKLNFMDTQFNNENSQQVLKINQFYRFIKILDFYFNQDQSTQFTNQISHEIIKLESKSFNKIQEMIQQKNQKQIIQRNKNFFRAPTINCDAITKRQNKQKLRQLVKFYSLKQILIEFLEKFDEKDEKLQQINDEMRQNNKLNLSSQKQIGKNLKRVEIFLKNEIKKYNKIQEQYTKESEIKRFILKILQVKILDQSQKGQCQGLLQKLQKLNQNTQYLINIEINQKIITFLENKCTSTFANIFLNIDQNKSTYEQLYINILYKKFISIFQLIQDFDLKLKYQLDFLQIIQQRNSKDLVQFINLYFQIGNSYLYSGNNAKSMYYFEKALNIIQNQHINQQSFSKYFNNIGVCFFKNGDYDNSIKFYELDLKNQIKQNGYNHLNTAATIFNIGNCYLYKQQFQKALRTFQKSLIIKLNNLNQKHRDIAITYNSIGMCYLNLKILDMAEYNLKKSLFIQYQILGERHPDTATTLNNLGYYYITRNSYQQGIEILKNSLDIKIQFFGQNHPENFSTYYNIGNAFKILTKYTKSIKYLKKAFNLIEYKMKNKRDIDQGSQSHEILLNQLVNILIINNNMKQAIYYLLKYSNLSNSENLQKLSFCYNKINIKKGKNLKLYKRFKEKAIEIQMLNKKNKIDREYTLSLFYYKANLAIQSSLYLQLSSSKKKIKVQTRLQKKYPTQMKICSQILNNNIKNIQNTEDILKKLKNGKKMMTILKKWNPLKTKQINRNLKRIIKLLD